MMNKERHSRVLLVEDHRETCILLQYMLREHFDIVVSSSFEEALAAVENASFSLYILDINLGEKRNGIDLLRVFRSMPEIDWTPALALTAYVLPGDRDHFLAAGFDAYLGKPFSREALLQAVDDALKGATA